jgi:3-oxoadipate enol-lactonase
LNVLEHECRGDPRHPPLLLLHALGSLLAMWDAQVAAFAAHFHVIRYSMRGHGASPMSGPAAPSIESIAADACALLDALRIRRSHWCGLSLGGMVAMEVASHAPERVDRLVLANTVAHFPPRETWSGRIATVRAQGMAPLADATMDRWFTPSYHERSPQEVERIRRLFLATDPSGYAAACAAIRDMDLRADLASIAAPTLVIAGAADAAMPPARMAELQRAIPGAALVTLDASHLSNVEAGSAFTAAVLAHLGVSW